jgi:glycosyltransferase involved in cell wall biosynthesis
MSNFVIIPAYNEEKHILSTLDKVKLFAQDVQVVVVDDGSKDKTLKMIKNISWITSLSHPVNLGKGAALKTGCEYALKQGADKIVVMDSDGQHDPKEIPIILNSLERYDLVFCCRKRSKNMPFILRLGNWFLNKVTEVLFNIKIDDTQSGYRGFTAKAYEKLRWHSLDYSVETEMIANAGKAKLKYLQIPIETIYHDKYKGTTVLDGFKIGFNMLIWRLRR